MFDGCIHALYFVERRYCTACALIENEARFMIGAMPLSFYVKNWSLATPNLCIRIEICDLVYYLPVSQLQLIFFLWLAGWYGLP